MVTYRCAACGKEVGLMAAPYLCPTTRAVAQPHDPLPPRRTPPPPADPFDLAADKGQRAKPRRRRKPAPLDWRGGDLSADLLPVN